MTKKFKMQKVDKDFAEKLRELSSERMFKKLDPKPSSFREMTKLLSTTEGFKNSIFELKTKPHKKTKK